MPEGPDEGALARDMIEVHGIEAPGVARANARAAALAGSFLPAKRWIRVLEAIQRRSAETGAARSQTTIIINAAAARPRGP